MKGATVLRSMLGVVWTVGPLLGLVTHRNLRRRCAKLGEWCPDLNASLIRVVAASLVILVGRYVFALILKKSIPVDELNAARFENSLNSSPHSDLRQRRNNRGNLSEGASSTQDSINSGSPGFTVLPSDQREIGIGLSRFSHNVFKTLYFLFVASYYYYVLFQAELLPPELGGSPDKATKTTLLQAFPFRESSLWTQPVLFRKIEAYFYVSSGFHLASLVMLLFEAHRFGADISETILQVSLALQLMIYGYLGKHWIVGAVLMLMHDICDILVSFSKCLVFLRYRLLALASGILLMAAWAYLRLYSFSKLLLIPLLHEVDERKSGLREIMYSARHAKGAEPALFAALLLCLLFMNIYWFALMAKSVVIFLSQGRVTDAHAPSNESTLQEEGPTIEEVTKLRNRHLASKDKRS